MESESQFQESTTTVFEWTVKRLKHLFESSRGESKSKVTKSARFGGGRWQILFYANAGTKENSGAAAEGHVSLYLSCEPTTEERELAMGDGGKWIREGTYKFSFELRNIEKSVLYNLKEAHNHTFSHKTGNWGWAQFAKRDNVYFNNSGVRQHDAFIITCTITSSPAPLAPAPSQPRQFVPRGLLETVGALLDDPLYSDVEFILPGRHGTLKTARKIWASRKLLKRADYFDTSYVFYHYAVMAIRSKFKPFPVFGSGFAEGSSETQTIGLQAPSIIDSDAHLIMNEFEDSDDEDNAEAEHVTEADTSQHNAEPTSPTSPQTSLSSEGAAISVADHPTEEEEDGGRDSNQRNVRAKLSHPSSPRSNQNVALPPRQQDASSSKLSVVVKDVAYTTYMALLYYLYTDTIVFAPLSSSFIAKTRPPATPAASNSRPSTPLEAEVQPSTQKRAAPETSATSRREWIEEWQGNNPGRPAPCSAKAMYRLADRYDLRDLKDRASQHIIRSLTVENIAYEVFSPFAAAFDEIRQVNFFLKYWKDIRASDAMRNVWQEIRNGRHPGFEEVWPVIALSLEFKPTSNENAESKPR